MKKEKNKNKTVKTPSFLIASLIIGVGLGTLGVGVYCGVPIIMDAINKKKDPKTGSRGQRYEYVDKKTGLKIIEYAEKFQDGTEKAAFVKSFKRQEGEKMIEVANIFLLKKLADQFLERGFYGGELGVLKEVIINDPAKKKERIQGFYLDSTNQIFLFSDSKSTSDETMIEHSLQVLVHEYGHHIAAQYAKAARFFNKDNKKGGKNDLRTSDTIGEKIPHEEVAKDKSLKNNVAYYKSSTWNKEFVAEFRKNLNFSEDKFTWRCYCGFNGQFSRHVKTSLENQSKTIQSHHSAAELFNYANNINNNVELNFNGLSFASSLSDFKVDKKTIEYVYSMDEQFTRKLQQFTFLPVSNFDDFQGSKIKWVENKVLLPYDEDTLFSKKIEEISERDGVKLKVGESISADYVFGGKFKRIVKKSTGEIDFKEENIKNNVRQLYEAYLKIMGYGSSISQMYIKTMNDYLESEITQSDLISFNEIKFSGYIKANDASNIKGIVYNNKNKNKLEHVSITKLENSKLFAKSQLNSKIKDLTPSLGKYISYFTNSFLNLNTVDLKTPIQFWNDKNEDNVFQADTETLKMSESFASITRPVTGFRNYLNNYTNTPIKAQWQISKNNILSKDY